MSALQNVGSLALPRPAIAMHGDIRYKDGFTHLDYVNPNAPKGGTLKQASIGSFDSLNPFIVKGKSAAGLNFLGTNLMYQSLMTQSYDEPFSMYGLIAETIELPEDQSCVAFNIHPDARWQNGTPITAEDVVWTFNSMMEHGTPFFKAYYGDVDTAQAISDRRVLFTFKHNNNAELPLILSQLSILPKHYWTSEERDISKTTLEPPRGSGPYKITKVDQGRSITYERVKNWWAKDLPILKGHYNFDTITYDYYKDNNVALQAFLSGEFDVREENTAKLWETAYTGKPFETGQIIKETIKNKRPQGMQAFIYNIRRPVFQDARVREALSYAFDFEWSNKQFAYGEYVRTNSFFENSDLDSNSYKPPQTDGSGRNRQNLRKASQLLEEAGYRLNKDGIRAKDGKELRFEIIDETPLFERWVLPYLANLDKIGVKARFRSLDPAQYQNRINDFDFDMTIGGFGQSSSPGNEQRDFWSSVKADMPGSRNIIGIKNPKIDALIEDVINASSREDLITKTRALDRELLNGHYVIPMWHYPYWRIAYWAKLARPDPLSDLTPAIATTWWEAK